MTNGERQKAYRERQGWVGRRKERDRKREARKGASVTIAPPVRYAPSVTIPRYGEIEYGPEPGLDVPYEEALVRTGDPWKVALMEPGREVVSEGELKAVQDLAAIVARKKAREVEVEM